MLTAFKTELQAIAVPPQLFFTPTLESFAEVNLRSDYLLYARNSVITSVVSTLLGLVIAAPAAYSMAFFRTKQHARHPDVDAVDQDDAGGRRAGAGLRDGADRRHARHADRR